ncbi:MAG: response regulator [Desulforhopalus sp.]
MSDRSEQFARQLEELTGQLEKTKTLLHNSQQNFYTLVEKNRSGMLVVDMNGQVLFANPAACDLLDRQNDELIGSTFGIPSTKDYTEMELIRPDKGIAVVEMSVSQSDWKGSPVFLVMLQDITKRKRAEEALRNSERFLRSTVDGLTAHITVLDNRGVIILTNKAYRDFGAQNGIDPGTVSEGTNYLAVCDVASGEHSEEATPFAEGIREVLSGKRQSFKLEYPCHSPDEERWFVAYVTQLAGEDPRQVIVAHQNITERKQAEEARDKLQAQLTQFEKAESLSRMAGAIAHHFNNQLAVVLGNLELALEGMPQDAAMSENLTSAMQGAQNAAEISGHMLTYLGQTTDRYISMDLSETCRQSVSSLQASVPKEIALNVDLLTPGPVVRGNANQIQQVLVNLITNAWEAMNNQQGKIDVIVKTLPRTDPLSMFSFPPDWKPENETFACLEVRDTGCGIEEKDIDKVFDPFFSSKFTGRGLGLALVLGIIKAHGGAVAVDSEKGVGSSFKVYLPVVAESVAQKPDEMTHATDMKTGGTILLVEDEEMIRNMTTSMLTRMGFKVLEAIDGVDAVEKFQKHQDKIDVVVSDLTMPRMDGWETLAALRRIRPDLPVIMVSGHDESMAIAGDHLESPQAFLHKPYKKSELIESLAKAMSGSNVE